VKNRRVITAASGSAATDAVSFGLSLPEDYTPVFAEGEWLPEWTVYLDNRPLADFRPDRADADAFETIR
jgi:uncharacterized protein YgfB (UPF0149 family)